MIDLRRVARSLELLPRNVYNSFMSSAFIPSSIRWWLLRIWGADVERSAIEGGCWFGSKRVSIGRSTFINHRCFFDASARITVGDRCRIGMGVMFATSSHEIGEHEQRAGTASSQPIVVGDGCWIGARAVVLPGVTIGPGSIVAAGAVVAADVPPNMLVGGVPAKVIRKLP